VAWIASALNTHRCTIYREIAAGTVPRLNSDLTKTKVYNAQRGQAVHDDKGQCKGPELKIGHDMRLHDFIRQKIKDEHFAPDVIAAVLRKEQKHSVVLCTKTIKRTTVYFADPFSSWQRGSNENFNRMVRKFIPKGADISKYTKKEIRQIEEWINNYPRRILNYLSAREVFEKELGSCQA
jgi:IS30 family transposase